MTSLALTLALAATPSAGSPGAAPPAATLLQEADRARGAFEEGITWTLEMESTEDGETTSRTFLVRARGVDALAEGLAPARHKGELYLFNDRSLWFLKPGLRRPISISARQRIQGDAANGDVASTHYARDYEGRVVGEEEIGGEPAWKLELSARRADASYDRIRYWISKGRRVGLQAEFLTVSGAVFKTAAFEYGNRARLGGGEIPLISRMVIRDAMGSGSVTVLRYQAPRAERHAPSLFNVNNVVR